MSMNPEPAGSAGPAAPEYPALPPGYVIMAESDLKALTDRVQTAEAEVERQNAVLARLDPAVRTEAEGKAVGPRAIRRLSIRWSCLATGHEHYTEADAQACIDAATGYTGATEGTEHGTS